MSFLIRNAELRDIEDLLGLASQFSLLNLPPDRDTLTDKIERSLKSFQDQSLPLGEAEYVFVIEDIERSKVVGSSLILAKHGTPKSPHSYFEVRKEERFSQDLGVGFIHQVLRLKQTTDGPTEIGGLLVDRAYRRMPEKLGKQISLVRFLFIGMHRERFEKRILCEFAPPLTREGRSEFWEALGRRFTGLPYQEADSISQRHKEFISSLFPQDDIYLCLLDPRARQVLGQVNEATRPAQHLLERLGFRYLYQVDPFDGGPHFDAATSEISLVAETQPVKLSTRSNTNFDRDFLIGFLNKGVFRACRTRGHLDRNELTVPNATLSILDLKEDEAVFATGVGGSI